MPRKKKGPYETEKDIFAVRLRSAMEIRGETQESLAKKVDVQRQTIGYYANGQSKPDTDRLAKISKALCVSADWLIGSSESVLPTGEVDLREFLSLEAISTLELYKMLEEREIFDFISYFLAHGDLNSLIHAIRCFKSGLTIVFGDYLYTEAEEACKNAAGKALVDFYFWNIVSGYTLK